MEEFSFYLLHSLNEMLGEGWGLGCVQWFGRFQEMAPLPYERALSFLAAPERVVSNPAGQCGCAVRSGEGQQMLLLLNTACLPWHALAV